MIGLDSYSRQVFIYLDTILIYISLWIDCLFEIRKIAVFPLALIAGWLQGHWWGFISRNYVVWPTFLLMNVFIALKGSHFWFLFSSETTGPNKVKFHMELLWDRGKHFVQMFQVTLQILPPCPYMIKTLKIIFSGTEKPMTLKLGM